MEEKIKNMATKIKLHPQTIDWNKFKKSDEYKIITDCSTISLSEKNKIYLCNRIDSAFRAGWDAANKNKK